MSSGDVYPQIAEASHVCKATVAMTRNVEPCHVEPCRLATGSYSLFSAQLAANAALLLLVLYGHVSATRTQCERHYPDNVVAKTLNIHECHIEGCCSNPNGMSLQNLSFSQSWVSQGTFEFCKCNTADS